MAAGAPTRAAGHTRSRGTVADGGDDRGAAHPAVELVRGSRAGPPRARPHLPARVAVRGPPRPAHRAGLLLRHARRRASRRRHPRPRRRAPRVRQRLPPPRLARRLRAGRARDAPVPLPRLDLRARRRPARGAAREGRPGDRPRRARPRADGGRDLGPVRVRQPGRGRAAAGGGAGRPARRRARARARRRRARLPPPHGVRDPGQLEGRARELPRVLPLPAQPSRRSCRSSTTASCASSPSACARASSTPRRRRPWRAGRRSTSPAASPRASSTCSSRR